MKSLPFKNTKEFYGLIAIILHWSMALGILGAYVCMVYWHFFLEEAAPERRLVFFYHASFGLTILVLVVLRILWRLLTPTPRAVGARNKLEHILARGMHGLLYLAMIVMPISGYFSLRSGIEVWGVWEMKSLIVPLYEQWFSGLWAESGLRKFFLGLHRISGTYLVWVLILLHAALALYHHFIRKDVVLLRMLIPGKF